MTDLWPDFSVDKKDTNEAISFLKRQASSLGKRTGDIVKATFSKIEYKNPMSVLAEGVMKAAEKMEKGSEIIEDELIDKKDGSILFQKSRYKFEIYNDTYHFRVFILECDPIYPITIRADEGIQYEVGLDPEHILENEEELKNVVERIFHSEKLGYIVRSMMRTK